MTTEATLDTLKKVAIQLEWHIERRENGSEEERFISPQDGYQAERLGMSKNALIDLKKIIHAGI